MSQKYVVSEDIHLLLKEWAKSRGFILPNRNFFSNLGRKFSKYMKQIFKRFELVSEEELFLGLQKLVLNCNSLPLLSLDRVYCQSDLRIDTTRLIDHLGDERGLGRRPDSPLIPGQLRRLQKLDIRRVVLVDDVVFSGESLERIIILLSKIGIQVPFVFAGIGVGEGIKRLKHLGIEVRCVRTYRKVIDQICQRDFYPGVPFCGRTLIGKNNVGVPYLLPFGDPLMWASIPVKWQKPLSKFCLEQTIELFEMIENCSNKLVLCSDLDRKVVSLPINGTRYVDCLREIISDIQITNPKKKYFEMTVENCIQYN